MAGPFHYQKAARRMNAVDTATRLILSVKWKYLRHFHTATVIYWYLMISLTGLQQTLCSSVIIKIRKFNIHLQLLFIF